MPSEYKRCVVYALADPRDQAIRYIGVTQNLRRRLAAHCKAERTQTSGPKVRAWLTELSSNSLEPIAIRLEEVDREKRQERESQWIYFGRSVGWDLLNTIGGYARWD